MLLVKTKIKESNIKGAGLGCFADEFIPKGKKIWEFNPLIDRVFSNSDLNIFLDIEKEFIKIYSYSHNNMLYLCIDNARFFNHSITEYNTYDPSDEYATYSNRDINIGEEIISNYETFGINDTDKKFNIDF